MSGRDGGTRQVAVPDRGVGRISGGGRTASAPPRGRPAAMRQASIRPVADPASSPTSRDPPVTNRPPARGSAGDRHSVGGHRPRTRPRVGQSTQGRYPALTARSRGRAGSPRGRQVQRLKNILAVDPRSVTGPRAEQRLLSAQAGRMERCHHRRMLGPTRPLPPRPVPDRRTARGSSAPRSRLLQRATADGCGEPRRAARSPGGARRDAQRAGRAKSDASSYRSTQGSGGGATIAGLVQPRFWPGARGDVAAVNHSDLEALRPAGTRQHRALRTPPDARCPAARPGRHHGSVGPPVTAGSKSATAPVTVQYFSRRGRTNRK